MPVLYLNTNMIAFKNGINKNTTIVNKYINTFALCKNAPRLYYSWHKNKIKKWHKTFIILFIRPTFLILTENKLPKKIQ